jgi:hypothetical protein
MNEARNHIMRIVLVLILFQFTAPAFLSVNAQGTEPTQGTCGYHALHNSLVIPILLKEKEETESRCDDSFIDFVALIDFSDQRYVLREFHASRFTPFIYRSRYDYRPPLFTLYGAFLI